MGKDDLPTVLISLLVPLTVIFGPTGSAFAEEVGLPEPAPVASAAPGEFLVSASPDQAAAAGLDVVEEIGFGWTLVNVPAASFQAPTETAAAVAAAVDFEVEPNYLYQLADEPLFDDQWSMENTGQTGGTVDADIDILSAWEVTTGSNDVIIAVLDTGAAFGHPDLTGSMWVNPGEVGGNGIDDDNNGYIDDVRGWDTVDGDSDPTDTHGHGTFVSTAAAASLNGVGMAGVAPESLVMPIRVCGDGGCPHSAILAGMAYAIDNGADVINLSLGGYGSGSSAMRDAIVEAVAAGIVVVAAAGNDGLDIDMYPFYPASYPIDGLISVAASDSTDGLASFSNYGDVSVDLTAPGSRVVGGWLPDSWTRGSGTSYSAPKVAGVVALMKAVNPNLDAAEIAEMVFGSTDVLSHLSGIVASGGRLNAAKAVIAAIAGPPGDVADEVLFYRSSDGVFKYYDVKVSAALGYSFSSGVYSLGWDSITAIDLDGDGSDEQFFYRSSDGVFKYYDVKPNGALGALLQSGVYSLGWDSITAVDLDGDGKDEFFFYRSSDGVFKYYDVKPNGALGALLQSGVYSLGWDSITAVDLDGDGKDEFFFYRSSDGVFKYYRMNPTGKLGALLASGVYSKGWDSITKVDVDGDGKDEFFFYRSSDGVFKYYRMNPNGSLGALLSSGVYSKGWSSITAINFDG